MDKKYAFGVDIGGTTIKIGLLTNDGEIVYETAIDTDTSDSGKNVLPDIAAKIAEIIKDTNTPKEMISGIGMGVPGAVNSKGVVNKLVNIGWGVVDAKSDMEAITGMRVEVGNDANVAALGEAWKGAAEGYDDVVMVTLGTGVGGGVVSGGRLIAGAHGSGGEIGHIFVNPDEIDKCGCGNQGCLEQYASATGIVRFAKKAGMDVSEAKDVFDLARKNDLKALKVIDQFATILGESLARVSCVADPEIFVIGGGVCASADLFLYIVEQAFRRHCFHAARETKFVIAQLGNKAGIFGAAKMVLD